MTNSQLRYLAHKALDDLHWLDHHVTVRNIRDRIKLEDTLRSIEKALLKMVDAPLREGDLALPANWPQLIP